MTRTYAARRVGTGLYVQPSNDGSRRFVIASYQDGRSLGLERGPWSKTHWAWGEMTDLKATEIERLAAHSPDDALNELRDVAVGANTMYESKRDAVDAALLVVSATS